MKVGLAELGKEIILSKISWKDFGADERDPKDNLKKISCGRKDPQDILERFGADGKIQKIS